MLALFDVDVIPNPFRPGGIVDEMHAKEMREHRKRAKLIKQCRKLRARVRELETLAAINPYGV